MQQFCCIFFVKQNALSVLLRNPPLPEWEAFARLFINTLRQGGSLKQTVWITLAGYLLEYINLVACK